MPTSCPNLAYRRGLYFYCSTRMTGKAFESVCLDFFGPENPPFLMMIVPFNGYLTKQISLLCVLCASTLRVPRFYCVRRAFAALICIFMFFFYTIMTDCTSTNLRVVGCKTIY